MAHEESSYPQGLDTYSLSTLAPTLPPPLSLHFLMCLPLHHFRVSISLLRQIHEFEDIFGEQGPVSCSSDMSWCSKKDVKGEEIT